ncbi:alpha/beta fold hydrolase [Thalassococcus lentus]|uniref:Alpha/beta fold hydrolase n=1 Tax=Thalassococcus lentus TaxID=1210524 RepID=A0ABT4XWN1_9RHOB|nr:alpha/beta fold hydrolase [Thalassococcus lentus]MDA7426379.1 alpha/beta fold hydrolase [Thalassococcus lentus]
MLNVLTQGTESARPPLLIVHGLYGSGRNWGVIAKRLGGDRLVLTPDMRNHGDSFWSDTHDYPSMADDLAEVIDAHGGKADVVGHSMGGKAAMVMALKRPELIQRLIVADIAPVAYSHDQSQFIAAMKSVDLSQVERRSDATDQLAQSVDDKTLQSFFTQSLDIKNKRWRLNLDALAEQMPNILGFPEVSGHFDGPTLFLSGAESDYVKRDYRPKIRELFPKARFARMANAGHWLHAERPRAFEESVRAFLDMTL